MLINITLLRDYVTHSCLAFAIVYHFTCRQQKGQQKLSEDGKYDLFSRSIKKIDFTYFKDSRKKWLLKDTLDMPIRPTLLRINYFHERESV